MHTPAHTESLKPSDLLRIHRDAILKIFSNYSMISNVRIVGSVARGEDKQCSDIDFLVDTAPGTTLFDIGGLHEDLEDLLSIPVDIISSGGRFHEYMKISMKKDAIAL